MSTHVIFHVATVYVEELKATMRGRFAWLGAGVVLLAVGAVATVGTQDTWLDGYGVIAYFLVPLAFVPLAAVFEKCSQLVMIHGRPLAIHPPRPINRLCMTNPLVRCSSGNLSATNALNGSIDTFPNVSSTHSNPAAIHKVLLCGMMIRAILLITAPVKK